MQEVPEPSKVLITSRHTQMRSVWPIHLHGLEEPQALALIRRHVQRLQLRPLESADDAELLPLVDVTEGNPKAIEMSLGHVKYSGLSLDTVIDHLHTAHQTVNDIFTYLFSHTWRVLTEDAKHVLLVAPFFGETVGKEALGGAADLAGYRLDMAIKQLVEMSMLDASDESGKTGQRYSIHPLIRAFANGHFGEQPEWEREARERWVAWYVNFLSQHDRDVDDWPIFAIFDQERENIFACIEWTLASQPAGSLTMVQQLWFFMYVRGYWRQCERFCNEALAYANKEGNTPARLWLTSHLGWLLTLGQGSAQEAIQQLYRVEEEIVALQQPTLLEETSVLNYLGQAYMALKNFDMAEVYESRFLDLANQVGNRRHALVARYYLAWIQFCRGRFEEARRTYQALFAEAQSIGYERAKGYCAYKLARTLSELGQYEEAEYWLNYATAMANQWNESPLQAYVLLSRAYLLWKQQRPLDAHASALAALDVFRRAVSNDYDEAAALVAQLEEELTL